MSSSQGNSHLQESEWPELQRLSKQLGEKQHFILSLLTVLDPDDGLPVPTKPRSAQDISDEIREIQPMLADPDGDVRWHTEGVALSLTLLENRGLVERIPVTKRHRGSPKFLWRITQRGCKVAY